MRYLANPSLLRSGSSFLRIRPVYLTCRNRYSTSPCVPPRLIPRPHYL